MQNGGGVPEVRRHQPQKLGGQGNFRHQQNGTFACIQGLLNEFQVNRRLAGTGNAVQKCRTGGLSVHLRRQPLKGLRLLVGEDDGRGRHGGKNFPEAQGRFFG